MMCSSRSATRASPPGPRPWARCLAQGGSSNIASAETMLFMKAATGAVKDKLDEFYSRIFTLALRLMGLDVVSSSRGYRPASRG